MPAVGTSTAVALPERTTSALNLKFMRLENSD
jgi:hypothetical protein